MDLKVSGDKLVITIDLKADQGLSKSGKSRIIATTSGNIQVPDTNGAVLGLNLYRPAR